MADGKPALPMRKGWRASGSGFLARASLLGLGLEALTAAIADAGIDKSEIDGVLTRSLRVSGAREAVFVQPRRRRKEGEDAREAAETPTFTEPAPVASLPLSYEYAYGGTAAMVLDDETRAALEAERAAADEAAAVANFHGHGIYAFRFCAPAQHNPLFITDQDPADYALEATEFRVGG